MRGDAKKVREIRPTLVSRVSSGDLVGAYQLLVETIGNAEDRGWGGVFEPTADLMRRIMALRPGDEGIDLAVSALCGQQVFGPPRNAWSQARYEQDLAQYRAVGFVVGIELQAQDWSCREGKGRAGCYLLAKAPLFPAPDCDCEAGCICSWYAITEGNEPPSPWRD